MGRGGDANLVGNKVFAGKEKVFQLSLKFGVRLQCLKFRSS